MATGRFAGAIALGVIAVVTAVALFTGEAANLIALWPAVVCLMLYYSGVHKQPSKLVARLNKELLLSLHA